MGLQPTLPVFMQSRLSSSSGMLILLGKIDLPLYLADTLSARAKPRSITEEVLGMELDSVELE